MFVLYQNTVSNKIVVMGNMYTYVDCMPCFKYGIVLCPPPHSTIVLKNKYERKMDDIGPLIYASKYFYLNSFIIESKLSNR